MERTRRIGRRTLALWLCVGATVALGGCGGGGGKPGTEDAFGTISDNHGHEAVISREQLEAGAGVLLAIQGSATHLHLVELTASEVVKVREGQRVTKTSSTSDGHQHTVTFN